MNINNSLFGKLVEGYNNIKLLCSGGVDSISGTHYLMTRNILLDKNVSVVHINHKLRKQNDDMEASVRKFCLDNNFPLILLMGLLPILRMTFVKSVYLFIDYLIGAASYPSII
jgi:tRNA(Ile)-lysidine synthase TilS/MesJ